jgi:hypothetical protein
MPDLNSWDILIDGLLYHKFTCCLQALTHMRYLFTIVISFFITGCSHKQPAIDERLISFDNKFVSDVDSVLRLPKRTQDAIFSGNMNSLIDTAFFKNREIYISCLSMATGCADYTGNIKYIKDTIKLELINLGDVVCTEQNCHRFIYRISNPENKRYVILKP